MLELTCEDEICTGTVPSREIFEHQQTLPGDPHSYSAFFSPKTDNLTTRKDLF